MLAPSEHGMFSSEEREMEHQHQGSMWPSKYGFYQVRGRRRENPQTSIREGENKGRTITIRQVAGQESNVPVHIGPINTLIQLKDKTQK